MNKKTVLIITISLILLFSVLWSIGYLQITYVTLHDYFIPSSSPERHDNIPSSALWYGNKDGGEWIDFKPIDNNDSCFECYRYNYITGEELSKPWWNNNKYCLDSGSIEIESLQELYSGFNEGAVYLSDGRRLIPDLTNIRDKFAMVKPGMTKDEVIKLLGNDYYTRQSVTTLYTWIMRLPPAISIEPRVYMVKTTNIVVRTEWVWVVK